jgi:formylmethanofuran dehydrogenase subunit E
MNKENWEKAVAFHGHECPGLAIGFRASEAAVERLGIGVSDDEQVVCITENDACGVDAVQALLSCTFGKGNLIYRGTGKQAFSFFERTSGKSMRVYLKARNEQGLSRAEWQAALLESPLEEIFEFSVPSFSVPERARLFDTLICEICGEGAPEHKMRLQEGKQVCLDCFNSYDRGWK